MPSECCPRHKTWPDFSSTHFRRSPTSHLSCSHRLWRTTVCHLPSRLTCTHHTPSPGKGKGSGRAPHAPYLQWQSELEKAKKQKNKSLNEQLCDVGTQQRQTSAILNLKAKRHSDICDGSQRRARAGLTGEDLRPHPPSELG